MDKERLFRNLDRKYSSKCELAVNIPLGVDPDIIWEEVLQNRRAKGIRLPLQNVNGENYWYLLTNKMISASEVIVEEFAERDSDEQPHLSSVATIEEIFFTGFLEGAQISIQDAMTFLQSGDEPSNVEELILMNNRQAAGFAAENMYHAIDSNYLHNLAYFLTEGIDNGSGDFRITDSIEIPSLQGETVKLPPASMIPELTDQFALFLADTKTHPLIKAAAAQAWILAVRPFPEGNERLARLLSNVILIRAGYSFFGEISISSIIAKTSYEYFRAIANILRTENGADLTYFMDYYMAVLSGTVNELRARRERQQNEKIAEEQKMAMIPLASPGGAVMQGAEDTGRHPSCHERISDALNSMQADGVVNFSVADIQSRTGISKKTLYPLLQRFVAELRIAIVKRSSAGTIYTFYSSGPHNGDMEEHAVLSGSESEGYVLTPDALISALKARAAASGENVAVISKKLIEYIENGKFSFTSAELAEELNLSIPIVRNCVKPLKKFGYLVTISEKNNRTLFTFAFSDKICKRETALLNILGIEIDIMQLPRSAVDLIKYLRDNLSKRKGKHSKNFAKQMVQYLAGGKYEYSSNDFCSQLNIHPTSVNELLRELNEQNLLKLVRTEKTRNVYGLPDIARNAQVQPEDVCTIDIAGNGEPLTDLSNIPTYTVDQIMMALDSQLREKDGYAVVADQMIEYLKTGKPYFTTVELVDTLGLPIGQVRYAMKWCKDHGLTRVIAENKKKYVYTFNVKQTEFVSGNEPLDEASAVLFDKLNTLASDMDEKTSLFAYIFLRFLYDGKKTFTTEDISAQAPELNMKNYDIHNGLRAYRKMGIIENLNDNNKSGKYRFVLQAESNSGSESAMTYSEEVLNLIKALEQSPISQKDRRIGKMLQNGLKSGIVTRADYEKIGKETRWNEDMRFAYQLGIVKRVNNNSFEILKEIDTSVPELQGSQRTALRELYDMFGDDAFSMDMVIANLDYSTAHASGILHQFTWLKFLDCSKGIDNKMSYQFLVNPTDNPECFEDVA